MKKVFLSMMVLALAVSCSNSDKKKTEGENEVKNELINNPSTADDPSATPAEYAVMTFKTTEHNFGDILEHQKVETEFEFKNTGKVDLLINNCQAACGCTVPNWPKHPIKPGEEGKIKVIFDSSGKGGAVNTKNVTVYANIPEKNIVLTFTANVRAAKQ